MDKKTVIAGLFGLAIGAGAVTFLSTGAGAGNESSADASTGGKSTVATHTATVGATVQATPTNAAFALGDGSAATVDTTPADESAGANGQPSNGASAPTQAPAVSTPAPSNSSPVGQEQPAETDNATSTPTPAPTTTDADEADNESDAGGEGSANTPNVPTAPGQRCQLPSNCFPSVTPIPLRPTFPADDILKIDPKVACAILNNCPEEEEPPKIIDFNPAILCVITGACGNQGEDKGYNGPMTVECLGDPTCSGGDAAKRAP